MRKIIYILVLVVFATGCSASRKQKRSSPDTAGFKANGNWQESILNQNITGRSFFIERAEFKIKSGDEEKSGLGTVKFLMPDKFLITLKSNAGIEVARIFLTGDSIMINDRFDKKMYYGSASFIKSKYGITTSVLPVILGDYVNDTALDTTKMNCSGGKVEVNATVKSLKIRYQIDCDKGKPVVALPENDFGENDIELTYGEFFKINDLFTPGLIEISDKLNHTLIEIRILKITIPWEGTIEFIPGKQYQKIHLL